MLIPPQLRQLSPGQDQQNNPGNNASPGENSSKKAEQSTLFIAIASVLIAVIVLTVMFYFVLRTLRRLNCRPKYIPGKYLKEKWRRWNVGAAYGQVSDGASLNRDRTSTTNQQSAEAGPQTNSGGTVRRDTSVRSVITLPPYSYTPKPTEQVIAREGEREGMDVVVEFPETADEEESRREDLMESLYQIRLQRREEIAERETRRQERREARERGDFIRLEQLRAEGRERARSRSSANGSSTNISVAAALAEHQSRGRDRRISSVSYGELGYVRHDGSRVRASSRDSDSRPLLSNAASMSSDVPDRSSGFMSVHSRGESYSSTLSLATGASDQETLTPVQSHAASPPSIAPPNTGPEEGDVGSQAIPPPDYNHLDWGDAPPYEPGTSGADDNPRMRELTPLPTITIDIASPVNNTPTTPTNPHSEELRQNPTEGAANAHGTTSNSS